MSGDISKKRLKNKIQEKSKVAKIYSISLLLFIFRALCKVHSVIKIGAKLFKKIQ